MDKKTIAFLGTIFFGNMTYAETTTALLNLPKQGSLTSFVNNRDKKTRPTNTILTSFKNHPLAITASVLGIASLSYWAHRTTRENKPDFTKDNVNTILNRAFSIKNYSKEGQLNNIQKELNAACDEKTKHTILLFGNQKTNLTLFQSILDKEDLIITILNTCDNKLKRELWLAKKKYLTASLLFSSSTKKVINLFLEQLKTDNELREQVHQITDPEGQTFIHYAAISNKVKMSNVLESYTPAEKETLLSIQDTHNRTPLHYMLGFYPKTFKETLEEIFTDKKTIEKLAVETENNKMSEDEIKQQKKEYRIN